MKEVLILRHAKAEAAHGPLEDHQRDLVPDGREAARRVGVLIQQHELTPQLIMSSDALRARRTTELSSAELQPSPETRFLNELYTADPMDYFDLLRGCPSGVQRVMIVAHNPTVEAFLGEAGGVEPRMRTAALALLRFPFDDWSNIGPGTAIEPAKLLTEARR